MRSHIHVPGTLRLCPCEREEAQATHPLPGVVPAPECANPAKALPPLSRSDTCEARAAGQRKRVLVRPQVARIPVPVVFIVVTTVSAGPCGSPGGLGKEAVTGPIVSPKIHIEVLQPGAQDSTSFGAGIALALSKLPPGHWGGPG